MASDRILFISQEIAPYVASTPLSELGRNLAQSAQAAKYEVRTFMPRFGTINERRNQLHEVIRLSGMNICINDNDHPLILKVASLQPSRIQVYFIDNDDYFQKSESDIDASGSNREDNDERMIFFARATMETVKKLKWNPRIVVVTGWMAALTALYLRRMFEADKSLSNTKIVYAITPDEAKAPIDPEFLVKLRADGVMAKDIKAIGKREINTDLLHNIGVIFSDAVIIAGKDPAKYIVKKIETAEKPLLRFDPEKDDMSVISEFYKTVINEPRAEDNEKDNE